MSHLRNTLILAICSVVAFLFSSCEKKEKDYVDFENYQWRLVHNTTQEIDANVPQLADDNQQIKNNSL